MTSNLETYADAWRRRAALVGTVDFTMMYVAHDAFNRDLARLVRAGRDGDGFSPQAQGTWEEFSRQLHTHHTAEDAALWPRLRAAVNDTDEARVLDDMEAEHASLDPRIERVDAAFADRNHKALVTELMEFRAGLGAHMRHEEDEALPLLERRLGAAGWTDFVQEIREQQGGVRGGAAYLPWVLDGATQETRRAVLGLLPAPARMVYRYVWEPRYRKGEHLT